MKTAEQSNRQLNGMAFDPQLTVGARNAVQVCLRVQPSEKVTVITDEVSLEIAAAIVHELEALGLDQFVEVFLGKIGRDRFQRTDNLAVVKFAATDDRRREQTRIRSDQADGRHSAAKARALTEDQPGAEPLAANGNRPAGWIRGAHAAIVGVEVIGQADFASRKSGRHVGFSLEVHVCGGFFVLIQ